jgi:hypothetical protein
MLTKILKIVKSINGLKVIDYRQIIKKSEIGFVTEGWYACTNRQTKVGYKSSNVNNRNMEVELSI